MFVFVVVVVGSAAAAGRTAVQIEISSSSSIGIGISIGSRLCRYRYSTCIRHRSNRMSDTVTQSASENSPLQRHCEAFLQAADGNQQEDQSTQALNHILISHNTHTHAHTPYEQAMVPPNLPPSLSLLSLQWFTVVAPPYRM